MKVDAVPTGTFSPTSPPAPLANGSRARNIGAVSQAPNGKGKSKRAKAQKAGDGGASQDGGRKRKAAKKAARTTSKGKGREKPKEEAQPVGRPCAYTEETAKRIIEGLSKGTPLTIVCEPDDMPCDDTVRNWMEKFPDFSRDIARARERGFDRIALDAIEIADNIQPDAESDTIKTAFGPIPNKEWILRSKLRVETRLKLLSKWDPKRYGDKITTEVSGPDGGPIQTEQKKRTEEETAAFAAMMAAADAKARPAEADES